MSTRQTAYEKEVVKRTKEIIEKKAEGYVVGARAWSAELAERFGEYGTVHVLTPEEVIAAIEKFGRASIWPPKANALSEDQRKYRQLIFENEYD